MLKFYFKYVIFLCFFAEIQTDLESMATIRSNWEKYADQGICVACYTEVDGALCELVGCNILVVRTTDDEEEDIDNVRFCNIYLDIYNIFKRVISDWTLIQRL